MAATYRNRLSLDRPYRGVMASIYDPDGVRVDVTTTDEDGYYEFSGLSTGPHIVKFYGRGYDPNTD